MTEELPRAADFVVVGGGVLGLAIARTLATRQPSARIVVLEKETRPGLHASGRNSGVLHAGFYYGADSLKARLCRDGSRRMSEWCRERGVTCVRTGKLVVASDEREHALLDELLRRAAHSQVRLESLSEAEARDIEPRVRTAGRALWSPDTATVDPTEVMAALAEEVRASGVAVCCGAAWTGANGRTVSTTRGSIEAGYLVNAAGLYADRIAHAYGFGARYRILPFKGLYLYGSAAAPRPRVQVYPVPDLAMPFLGVHFTVPATGGVKIGPTALPALWRESYGEPHALSGISAREIVTTVGGLAGLLATDRSARRLALDQSLKRLRYPLVRQAARMLDGVRAADFTRWGPIGIRAQLYDTRTRRLVMDFCFEHDDRSLHLLNAVSPAFTCALSFADVLVDAIGA